MEALKWVARKLELLRLRFLRGEVSVEPLADAKPRLDEALASLRSTHHFRDEEADEFEYLAGEEELEEFFEDDGDN